MKNKMEHGVGDEYMLIKLHDKKHEDALAGTKDYRLATLIKLGHSLNRKGVAYDYQEGDTLMIPMSEQGMRKVDIDGQVYHIVYVPLNVLMYFRKGSEVKIN